jgi:predicted dehydrogenase
VRKELGIGLIGTGFMGKAHAFAYRARSRPSRTFRCRGWSPTSMRWAAKAAHQYGFARSTSNWRDLVNDPRVDVVSITTPNTLHKEMALAALAAGKHVHCEKPLSPTLPTRWRWWRRRRRPVR